MRRGVVETRAEVEAKPCRVTTRGGGGQVVRGETGSREVGLDGCQMRNTFLIGVGGLVS